jgi:hypothetical protein
LSERFDKEMSQRQIQRIFDGDLDGLAVTKSRDAAFENEKARIDRRSFVYYGLIYRERSPLARLAPKQWVRANGDDFRNDFESRFYDGLLCELDLCLVAGEPGNV